MHRLAQGLIEVEEGDSCRSNADDRDQREERDVMPLTPKCARG
jgi:hypothetical protein